MYAAQNASCHYAIMQNIPNRISGPLELCTKGNLQNNAIFDFHIEGGEKRLAKEKARVQLLKAVISS